MQKVCLGVSDLQRSVHYWTMLLGMKVIEKNEEKKTVLLGFADTQVSQIRNKLLYFVLLCLFCVMSKTLRHNFFLSLYSVNWSFTILVGK